MKTKEIAVRAGEMNQAVSITGELDAGDDHWVCFLALKDRARAMLKEMVDCSVAEATEHIKASVGEAIGRDAGIWGQVKDVTKRIVALRHGEWTEEKAEELFLKAGEYISTKSGKLIQRDTKEKLLATKGKHVALKRLREDLHSLESIEALANKIGNDI